MNQVNRIEQNEKTIKCQNCKVLVSNQAGYYTTTGNEYANLDNIRTKYATLLCPRCGFWNIYSGGKLNPLLPVVEHDEKIDNLEGTLLTLFDKIQEQANHNNWRIVILLSRILIMHVAINNGAEENKNFQQYVKYLEDNNLVNKHLSDLIDGIRINGNTLNHEIEAFKAENDEKIKNDGVIIYSVVVDTLDHLYKYKHLKKTEEEDE